MIRPSAYTHQQSGRNLLEGLALLQAWDRGDADAFEALIGDDLEERRSAVVGVCRAARSVIRLLVDNAVDLDTAVDVTRHYGLFRRDDLGGSEPMNSSNVRKDEPWNGER